jgi:hypothetical protein
VLLGVLFCERLTGSLGSPSPAATSTFLPGPAVSLRPPSTPSFRLRLHPPSSFPPPPEFYGLRPARCISISLATNIDQRAPPLGSRPSSRHQPAASTTPQGVPTPRSCSLLAVSHDLEGLLRLQLSRVCFTPQPRPGFALQGFVPLRGAVPAFAGPFMPSGWLDASACGCPRQPLRPQLQGFAPRGECGVVRGGLDPDRSAPLVGFSSSGFSLRATCRCLHTRSARDLHRDEPTAAGLRRFRRCTDWLAWDQAADPLEVCGLNPRPPFESRVRGHAPGSPPRPPDTGPHMSILRATLNTS